MSEPSPHKPFQDLKLKEMPDRLVEGAPVEASSALSLLDETGIIDGQESDKNGPKNEASGPATALSQPSSTLTSFGLTNLSPPGEPEYHGLLRHRFIVCACVLLAVGIFALSAIELAPLIKTEGTINSSLQVQLDPNRPRLSPDLVYYGGVQPDVDINRVRENGWGQSRLGLVNFAGKVVLPPKFADIGQFHEGLAQATLQNEKNARTLGFIDQTGKLVIPATYENVQDFHGGAAMVHKDSTNYLIDKSGKILFQATPDMNAHVSQSDRSAHFDPKETAPDGQNRLWNESLSDSDLLVTLGDNNKFGLLDRKGHWATKPDFDSIVSFDADNFAGYKALSESTSGHTIEATPVSPFTSSKNDLWGVLDSNGNELFTPKFERVLSFQNNHAAVLVDGKYGFADAGGNIVIEPAYDFVTAYDKIIAVKKGKIWSFIDSAGKPLNVPAVDGVIHSGRGVWLSDGLGPVVKNGKVGFLNDKGGFAIQPKFDWALTFADGYAPVFDGTYWHYINRLGRRVSENLGSAESLSLHKADVTVPGPLFSFAEFMSIERMNNTVRGWEGRVSGREKKVDE